MDKWFTKNLGDAMLAGDALAELEAEFLSTYKDSDCQSNTAVFIRHESEGHLHCELKAYFSPETVDLATAVDADPCVRPARDGLSLLVGAHGAFDALFPKQGE